MIVDLRNDRPKELAFRSRRLGEENPFRTHYLPMLRAGNVGLQVCAASRASELAEEATLRHVLEEIAALATAAAENRADVIRVLTRDDLETALSGERIGLVLMLEGAEPLGYSPELFGPHDLPCRTARQTVLRGETHPSRLVVPTLASAIVDAARTPGHGSLAPYEPAETTSGGG